MDGTARRPRGRPRLTEPGSDAASVQSLDRAITLLASLAEANGLTLMQVSGATGLPPSTVHRMLTTLQRHGLVEFEEAVQHWHVGVEAFRIGSSFLRRRKIVDRSRPLTQHMAERFGETANLAVADEDAVVFASQVEAHTPLRAFFRPGTRSPYHASGIGKAILAHLPPERALRIVARAGLQRFTARTLAEPEALRASLTEIRTRGWAVDDEERYDGMRCVAAAVFNEFAEPVGGISLSGPAQRLTDEAVRRMGPVIHAAAAAVTHALAGQPPADAPPPDRSLLPGPTAA